MVSKGFEKSVGAGTGTGKRHCGLSCGLGLLLAATALTPATTWAAPDDGGAQASSGLETVVVTARKRAENLQRVPVSVTALSAADLQEKSLTSFEDVGQFVPNFNFDHQGQNGRTGALVYIRGIGQSDSVITNDPGVGIYLDGVYVARMQGLDMNMMDIKSIEVLRGPQGTLFGKNTIGGAVNIVTNNPSLEDLTGNIQATTGSYSRFDVGGVLNVPIEQDKLAVRLTGLLEKQNGYGVSLSDGQHMGDTNRMMGSAKFLYQPLSNLSVLLSIDGGRIREDGAVNKLVQVSSVPLVNVLNLISNPPFDNRWITNSDFTNYSNSRTFNNADTAGASLTVTWDTDLMTIKSITAYQNNKSKSGVDPDGSPFTIIYETDGVGQHQWSQEFQFSGTDLGNRLKWVGGLYYFSEDAGSHIVDLVYNELVPLGIDINFTTDLHERNTSYAAYGQGTYFLTHKLSTTLGARYTIDQKKGDVHQYAQDTGAQNVPFTAKSRSWDSFSPQGSISYQWTPDVMTYISAANGFKSGGFNGRAEASAGFVSYNPETVWTYEAGLRSQMLDEKLRFNATLFLSEYRDIQFTVIQGSSGGVPTTIVGNAGSAEIKGGELEIEALPLDGLILSGALGLTDAHYTKVSPAAAPITTQTNFSDTPKWSGTLSAQYTVPIGDSFDLSGRIDYAYKSKVYFNASNSPWTTLKSYGVANARMTFETQDQTWSLSVFGTNITNEHYFIEGTDFLSSLGFAQVEYAAPAEWGLTAKYQF